MPAQTTKRGRPKGSGTRAAEALAIVRGNPGITVPEVADKMGIKQNYLYRVLPGLADDGLVRKDGTGWYPVDGGNGSAPSSAVSAAVKQVPAAAAAQVGPAAPAAAPSPVVSDADVGDLLARIRSEAGEALAIADRKVADRQAELAEAQAALEKAQQERNEAEKVRDGVA